MRRAGSTVLVVLGALTISLGLLFVVGAGGEARRYAIAALLLGVGAVLVGTGVRFFRRAAAESPEQVLAEILDLARLREGEATEVEVAAALGRRFPLAAPVLARLVAEGLCERRIEDGGARYVFKDLQPRLFLRKCRYCGCETSIANPSTSCIRCGGALETRREPHDAAGEYRMDE